MEVKSYSRKQAGVIYRAIKDGKLNMSKGAISEMYDMVGEVYISMATRDYMEERIYGVRLAVSAIFENDYEQAERYLACFEN